MSDQTILSARSLCRTFKRKGQEDFKAVDDVSFDVVPGECLGIVGESGSGKSTTVRMVTRLLATTSGTVELAGRDITHAKGRELREAYRIMQMVFQTPTGSFDPRHTLGHGITESMRNAGVGHAEAQERAATLLGRCGLGPEFAKRYPHEVSGGQCQRAAIARALAIEPKLLVCDEATSALDMTVQKAVVGLLSELRRETGMAILFICHDIALVQEFCDRVLVMYHGRVVEQGAPDDVIRNPREAYTRQLIDAVL